MKKTFATTTFGIVALSAIAGLIVMSTAALAASDPYSHHHPSRRSQPPMTTSTPAPEASLPGVVPPDTVEGKTQGRPPTKFNDVVQPGRVPGAPEQQPGILPFTGADLLLYGATGAAAITTGLTLTRIGRNRSRGDS